ncbi:unannotated protein [freshwater metagenome]|uniref:Unannotated protein n=1 Tax=freshwater metagenome TaxID=449393 RepID=A0A6J7E133_9ZZZZ
MVTFHSYSPSGNLAHSKSILIFDSFFSACALISAIEICLIECFFANSSKLAPRIIEPSSFTNSEITATGYESVSSHKAAPASVCPPLACTPPSTATNGKMCPGRKNCAAFAFGSARARKVFARSCALIPVVRPSIKSTETVNAVSWLSSFRATIIGSLSFLAISLLITPQITPAVCRTIKPICSVVAAFASKIKSPSFSRSASSVTIKNFPFLKSANASVKSLITSHPSWQEGAQHI